jgi:hypothetical protein
VSTKIEEPELDQPSATSKAPWETPTLDDFSIEKETAIGTQSGMDGTSGPMGS